MMEAALRVEPDEKPLGIDSDVAAAFGAEKVNQIALGLSEISGLARWPEQLFDFSAGLARKDACDEIAKHLLTHARTATTCIRRVIRLPLSGIERSTVGARWQTAPTADQCHTCNHK